MKKSIVLALAALSVSAFVSSSALAEETAKDAKAVAPAATTAAPTTQKAKDYGYTFDDDPLNSNVQGTTGFVLKVRPPAARQLLSKPRVSFVPELLKTVEGI